MKLQKALPPKLKTRVMISAAFFLFLYLPLTGQETYQQFFSRSLSTSNTGMYVLGSWAVVNIATGIYGWTKFEGDKKYFSQMNFFWNTVNLSIAGIALYNNHNTNLSMMAAGDMIQKHMNLEKTLLINSGLDLGYIGTGFLLRHLSTTNEKRQDLLEGYGNSLILQGGFLLVFDAVMYGILRSQRIDFMNNVSMALSSDQFLIRAGMNF